MDTVPGAPNREFLKGHEHRHLRARCAPFPRWEELTRRPSPSAPGSSWDQGAPGRRPQPISCSSRAARVSRSCVVRRQHRLRQENQTMSFVSICMTFGDPNITANDSCQQLRICNCERIWVAKRFANTAHGQSRCENFVSLTYSKDPNNRPPKRTVPPTRSYAPYS